MKNVPTCTRILEADIGHRVLLHESKCAHIHGHRYKFEVTARAQQLDGVGRVIDFGVIKSIIGTWIDKHWDHGLLLNAEDPLVTYMTGYQIKPNETQKCYVLPYNPTAENIAKYLYRIANTLLAGTGVEVCHVRVHETPNCWADYTEAVSVK